jgi:hypothetical protein
MTALRLDVARPVLPDAEAIATSATAKRLGILLVMYGPAADVKEKSPVQRLGTDAVMYPAS